MPDEIFGDITSGYSRKQAIEDGVLVDLMQPETVGAVREAGFKYPIAMTAAAYSLAVWPIDSEEADKWLESECQDLQGRLWDALWMLRFFIKREKGDSHTVYFPMLIVNWQTKRRESIVLKSVCGPNDDGSPCITISLPEEE